MLFPFLRLQSDTNHRRCSALFTHKKGAYPKVHAHISHIACDLELW